MERGGALAPPTVYKLTGPEALTIPQKVRILGEALGRRIDYVELSDAQARERWRGAGFGEDRIELIAAWHGKPPPEAYTVTGTVEQILGRPPQSFASWAEEHARAFLASGDTSVASP